MGRDFIRELSSVFGDPEFSELIGPLYDSVFPLRYVVLRNQNCLLMPHQVYIPTFLSAVTDKHKTILGA